MYSLRQGNGQFQASGIEDLVRARAPDRSAGFQRVVVTWGST